MTRCVHTGLSVPECSCRSCLLELVRTHAPRPAPALEPPRAGDQPAVAAVPAQA
jgi:hypothetical protein